MVMLHRALFGSLERFLVVLLEQHGPFLPDWLAPVQVRILAVTGAHEVAAAALLARLRAAGLRAEVESTEESLGRRIALARQDGVAWVAVLGEREVADGTVAWKAGSGKQDSRVSRSLEESVGWIRERCRSPA